MSPNQYYSVNWLSEREKERVREWASEWAKERDREFEWGSLFSKSNQNN